MRQNSLLGSLAIPKSVEAIRSKAFEGPPDWNVKALTHVNCVQLCGVMRRAKTMSEAIALQEKARMFERRAEEAINQISREHYKEMAAHYRSLAVEHLVVKDEEPAQ